jgi:hypothetical protein
MQIGDKGVNFYNIGQQTRITKQNAINAFNLLAPKEQQLINPRILKLLNINPMQM